VLQNRRLQLGSSSAAGCGIDYDVWLITD